MDVASHLVVGPTRSAEAAVRPDRGTGQTRGPFGPQGILDLQGAAGNAAVEQLLAQWLPVEGAIAVQRFGERGHERVQQEAFAGGPYSSMQRREIAFGSWANDFNQINLAGQFIQDHLGLDIPNEDLFEIARIVAEDQFGAAIAAGMTAERFGTYEPAQHFDNPSTTENARPDAGPVAEHIESTRGRIRSVLHLAIEAEDEGIAFEHYGSALHIMEDFFAHTNFIELALRSLETPGVQARPGTSEPQSEQLVGGVFGTADTVVSVLHILADYLLRPPGRDEAVTAGDRIALILLRRRNPTLAAAYKAFCGVRLAMRQSMPGYERISREVREEMAIVSGLLGVGANQAAALVAGQATGGGHLPVHARMHKDDPSRGQLYELADALAVFVDRQMDPVMQQVWGLRRAEPRDAAAIAEAEGRLSALIEVHLNHPAFGNWWEPIVRPYAERMGAPAEAGPVEAGTAPAVSAAAGP